MALFKHKTLFLGFCIFISGCQIHHNSDIKKLNVISNPKSFKSVEVTSPTTPFRMTVRHMVSNDSIFVECYIPGFNFSGVKDKNNTGHLMVTIDEQDPYRVYKAAFVVKDLSKGRHHVTLTLSNNDGEPYKEMKKHLDVDIS